MPAFRFEAADAAGQVKRGVLDADSARHARATLRERGMVPLEVASMQEGGGGAARASPVLTRRLRAADLSLVTRQLASLLAARLPIEQALTAVVEQAEKAMLEVGRDDRQKDFRPAGEIMHEEVDRWHKLSTEGQTMTGTASG
ncbi:MAG: hypothetical protein ACLGHY_05885, partial [Gammaproteobacteria bacterium]